MRFKYHKILSLKPNQTEDIDMLLNDGLYNITNLEGTRRSDIEYIAPETNPLAK